MAVGLGSGGRLDGGARCSDGDGRGRARVLEALGFVFGEARADGGAEGVLSVGGGAETAARGVLGTAIGFDLGMVELVVGPVVGGVLVVLFVEGDDVDDGLGVLFLLLLGDAVGAQGALPFFGEALREIRSAQSGAGAGRDAVAYGELARLAVVADVGDMNGILGGRNGGFARSVDQVVHEAGEAAHLPRHFGLPHRVGHSVA